MKNNREQAFSLLGVGFLFASVVLGSYLISPAQQPSNIPEFDPQALRAQDFNRNLLRFQRNWTTFEPNTIYGESTTGRQISKDLIALAKKAVINRLNNRETKSDGMFYREMNISNNWVVEGQNVVFADKTNVSHSDLEYAMIEGSFKAKRQELDKTVFFVVIIDINRRIIEETSLSL